MAGHETGNGRIGNLITNVLAIEEVGTAHLRDHIIDLLDQTVAVVRRRSRRSDSHDESRLHRHSPARNQAGNDRNDRSGGSNRSSDRNAEMETGQSRRDDNQHIGQPLFVDYDSTPIQVLPSNLPSIRLEVDSSVQTVTSIPAVDSTTQSARVEEPTLKSGTTPAVENNNLNRISCFGRCRSVGSGIK